MAEPKETILSFPASFVAQCPGLSFDLGSSVAKFVYRAKVDIEENQNQADTTRNELRLVSFAWDNLEFGLEWIKRRVQLTPPKEGELPHVCGTGMVTELFVARIVTKFRINVHLLRECDCIFESHRYLYQNFPCIDIEYPVELSPKDKEDLAETINKFIEEREGLGFTNINQKRYLDAARTVRRRLFRHILDNRAVPGEVTRPLAPASSPPGSPDINEKFPALLAVVGSSFAYYKVTLSDVELVSFCARGGKTLMGLGSLLLGVRNLDELVDLAEKGTANNMASHEVIECNDVSSFGLVYGTSITNFRREDIANTLLHQTVWDCVQNIVQLCAAYDLRNVMLTGSFVSHPYVRRMINKEWFRFLVRHADNTNFTGDLVMRTMRHGQYCGAIACMINSVQPFMGM